MKPLEVDFLRRLHGERPALRTSHLAMTFARDEGLGRVEGTRVCYTDADWQRAATILTTRGFELDKVTSGFSRSAAPAGGSEKSGARTVTSALVAVVPLHMAPAVPLGSFLCVPWERVLEMDYEVLLVCENLEPLMQLHEFEWLEGYVKGRRTLAVFRGAVSLVGTGAAADLIERDTRPTLAFFDFDPAGLVMAAALPRREAVCLPPWETLEEATKRARRDHLFTNSVGGCRAALDREADPQIAEAWRRMRHLALALNQEGFPRAR